MKPKELLNVIVAGFGIYSLWQATRCGAEVILVKKGLFPNESSTGFIVWMFIDLIIGLILIRYGSTLTTWMLPKNWPSSRESEPEQPKE